jgi:lipoate-protein ligase A
VPRSHPWARSPLPLYDAVHDALVRLLETRGVAARRHPGHPASAADPLLCFSRRAAGDVVAGPPGRGPDPDDPKVLGSAQRRLAAAVVQHGSLLLGANESVGAAARHAGLAELGRGGAVESPRDLGAAWVEDIAAAAGLDVEWREDFAGSRPAEVTEAAARFHDPRWLERR